MSRRSEHSQISSDERLARSLQQQEYAHARQAQHQQRQRQELHRHIQQAAGRTQQQHQHQQQQQQQQQQQLEEQRLRRRQAQQQPATQPASGTPRLMGVLRRVQQQHGRPQEASPRPQEVQQHRHAPSQQGGQPGGSVQVLRVGTPRQGSSASASDVVVMRGRGSPGALLRVLLQSGALRGLGRQTGPVRVFITGEPRQRNVGANSEQIEGSSGRFVLQDASKLTDENRSCAVCQMEFENGEELRALPCLHLFHPDCVDTWLKSNKSCPTCRADISDMERKADELLSRPEH